MSCEVFQTNLYTFFWYLLVSTSKVENYYMIIILFRTLKCCIYSEHTSTVFNSNLWRNIMLMHVLMENKTNYYVFCYLLSLYSFHYYSGVLHGFRVISLFHVYTMSGLNRTRGLLTASAGPWAFPCLKMYINLMMCLTMSF